MNENNKLTVESQTDTRLAQNLTPSDIPCKAQARLAVLWQTLYAENKVSSPQAPESYHIPWYIAGMQAVAAWIAALFLLGFIVSLFRMTIFQVRGLFPLCIGLIYLVISLGLYFSAHKKIFIQQFAFASCLSGVLGVGWGLHDLFGDFKLVWYLSMAGVLLLLWRLIPHQIAQFVFAFCLSWCFISIALKIDLLGLSPSVFVLIVSLLLLNLNQFGRHYQRGRMLIYGFALTLLTVQLSHVFGSNYFFDRLFIQLQSTWWFIAVQLLTIFLIGNFLLVSIYRDRHQSLTSLSAQACFMGLIFISALSIPMQGLSTAILFILLGYYCNELWLKGIGIISALLFVSGYYYSLETTLLLKSGYLMGLGAILLLARVAVWQLFPVNENAKEDVLWEG